MSSNPELNPKNKDSDQSLIAVLAKKKSLRGESEQQLGSDSNDKLPEINSPKKTARQDQAHLNESTKR